MSRIRRLFAADIGAATTPPILDLEESRGSGDLLLTNGGAQYAGYINTMTVSQGPTISGPWTPIPGLESLPVPSGVPGFSLTPFRWSARFITTTPNNIGGGVSPVCLAVITPGGNRLG